MSTMSSLCSSNPTGHSRIAGTFGRNGELALYHSGTRRLRYMPKMGKRKYFLVLIVAAIITTGCATSPPAAQNENNNNSLLQGDDMAANPQVLKIGKPVAWKNSQGQTLKITLDSIEPAKNSAPGSRLFYRLSLKSGARAEKIVFDPQNSGMPNEAMRYSLNGVNYEGFKFRITKQIDEKTLEVLFTNDLAKEQALKIAKKESAKSGFGNDLVFLEDKSYQRQFNTPQHDIGWIFFFTTKKYAQTKLPQNGLNPDGYAPVIVNISDGIATVLETSVGTNEAIYKYEKGRQLLASAGAEKPASIQLIISKSNAGRIGTINFDKSNHASLFVEGSNPAIEQLKKDWGEISKMDELIWKHDEIDGSTISIVGESIKPGDENYFYAVMSTLERKYGYLADIARQ